MCLCFLDQKSVLLILWGSFSYIIYDTVYIDMYILSTCNNNMRKWHLYCYNISKSDTICIFFFGILCDKVRRSHTHTHKIQCTRKKSLFCIFVKLAKYSGAIFGITSRTQWCHLGHFNGTCAFSSHTIRWYNSGENWSVLISVT